MKKWTKWNDKNFDARWGTKMTHDVMGATMDIMKHINPTAKKAIGEEEWLLDGQEVEEIIWKLLKKTRKITQLETKP